MNVGTPEIIIIVVIIALVIGGERFMRFARQMGENVAKFQRELGVEHSDNASGDGKRNNRNLGRDNDDINPTSIQRSAELEDTSASEGEPLEKVISDVGLIEVQGSVSGKGIAIGHSSKVIVIEHYEETPPDLGEYVESPIGVFVSSADDLYQERDAARKAIESLAGLSRAWLVDITASSYRREDLVVDFIRRCDVFLSIFGPALAETQINEHALAKINNIANRLYFIKDGDISESTCSFLKEIDANVVKFSDTTKLEEMIKRSLISMMISSLREHNRYNLTSSDLGLLLGWGEALKIDANLLDILRHFISSIKEEHRENRSHYVEPALLPVARRDEEDKKLQGDKLSYESRYKEAIDAYSEALKIKPDYRDALEGRGQSYRMVRNYPRALADLTKALQLSPDSAFALRARGTTYLSMGEYKQALADLTKALRLDPNSAFALEQRGETYRMLNKNKQALADVTKALRLNPNSASALETRGATYLSMSEYKQALADLTKALRLDPNSTFALEQRGETYLAMKDYRRASVDLRQALKINPHSEHAKEMLSSLSKKLK